MSYSKISLFLLLSSSMALMAMKTAGTEPASTVGQTAASESTLDELKKLFPYATIYHLTGQDKIFERLSTSFQLDSTHPYLNFWIPGVLNRRPRRVMMGLTSASEQQIVRLTNASGRATVRTFQPCTLSQEDKAFIAEKEFIDPLIFFAGISIPGTEYVIVAQETFIAQ